jgi:lysine 6-dehydrogenase
MGGRVEYPDSAMKIGVIGAGRQGVAAAYDLAKYTTAAVVLADIDLNAARAAAERIAALTGRDVTPVAVDVNDVSAVRVLLEEWDACASAVPYDFHLRLARTAVESHCSFCDLGGNTAVVEQELELGAAAMDADVSVVPDCGVGPGLISNLAVYAMSLIENPDTVHIYDGGLLQHRRPPYDFALLFHVGGLTNEYYGDALYIVDGSIRPVPAFDPAQDEAVDIPGFGVLEAFTTSGAMSTLARTYEGRLRSLTNKTLRYPGHAALMRPLLDLGFLGTAPVAAGGQMVVPRDLTNTLLADAFTLDPADRDVMVIHIVATGTGGDEAVLDMQIAFDEETGFTGMERATGFHLAIVAALMAEGLTPRGAVPLETAVDATTMVERLARRNIIPSVTRFNTPS